MNFLVMKNNNVVIKGYNHVQQYHLPSSKREYWIFYIIVSIDFRIILFSDSDTYFWLWVGLLGLISRYLYAHEGRPLLHTEKHQLIQILKWQRNFISLSYRNKFWKLFLVFLISLNKHCRWSISVNVFYNWICLV